MIPCTTDCHGNPKILIALHRILLAHRAAQLAQTDAAGQLVPVGTPKAGAKSNSKIGIGTAIRWLGRVGAASQSRDIVVTLAEGIAKLLVQCHILVNHTM